MKSDGGSEITYNDTKEKTSEQKEHDREIADRFKLQSDVNVPNADQEEEKKAPEVAIQELEV